jgi:hypothetical protein
MWLVVATALSLTPCPQAVAKSVQHEFTEAWNQRLARYSQEFETARSALPAAMAAFLTADESNAPDLQAKFNALMAASDDLGYRAGRAQMSQSLLKFMDSKPSAERGDLWLQEQVDILGQSGKKARADLDRVKAMKVGENGATADSLLNSLGMAVFFGGAVRGQAEELSLINENLRTYYRVKSQQDAKRRAIWSDALRNIAQSFQDQSRANTGWTAHCTTFGGTTNCSGQ